MRLKETYLHISDITATDLQDDIIGPLIIDEYREQVTKRMEGGGYFYRVIPDLFSKISKTISEQKMI